MRELSSQRFQFYTSRSSSTFWEHCITVILKKGKIFNIYSIYIVIKCNNYISHSIPIIYYIMYDEDMHCNNNKLYFYNPLHLKIFHICHLWHNHMGRIIIYILQLRKLRHSTLSHLPVFTTRFWTQVSDPRLRGPLLNCHDLLGPSSKVWCSPQAKALDTSAVLFGQAALPPPS